MYRHSYVEINLSNIKHNVETFIKKYNKYQYYFGVVKADSYGHNDILPVKSIIEGGCNYLAVSSLDEALEIRKQIKDIPILCLGIINVEYLFLCLEKNITVTISNLEYLEELLKNNLKGLKVHIKVDTGMNRLGFKKEENLTKAFKLIKESDLELEGIYTHIYDPMNEANTDNQIKSFEQLTKNIDLKSIKIVHLTASDATMQIKKKDYMNGYRLGIVMYGLMDTKDINYLPTFKLYSEVIQINEVENETVGYSGKYKVHEKEKIGVVCIGYADGIIRKNTGRYVYINDTPYKIVGNICMDMLFIKIDDNVEVGDKVEIIRDNKHIEEIAHHLDTITYEVITSIGKRVPRIYITK